MHLVQILLPRVSRANQPFPQETYDTVRQELISQFGGLTAYSRAPAKGLWADEPGKAVVSDDILVYEVMTEELDRPWWTSYRAALEKRFDQDELIIRAHGIEQL